MMSSSSPWPRRAALALAAAAALATTPSTFAAEPARGGERATPSGDLGGRRESGRVDPGHGAGRVDPGHGGGRVDPGPSGGRFDPGQRGERFDPGHRGNSAERGHRGGPDRVDHPGHRAPPGAPERHWWDGAHGHNHRYPAPGWRVATLPRHAHFVWWGGVNYRFWDGVWYAPGSYGYVVVRPPVGVIVRELPAIRTVLTIGGLTYLYANGIYYRDRGDGSYEVVPQPLAGGDAPPPERLFVYPREGQSPQQQSSDEYECHRWATQQTGFDPTAVAIGTGTDMPRRSDYLRARSACLEGRGYTVR